MRKYLNNIDTEKRKPVHSWLCINTGLSWKVAAFSHCCRASKFLSVRKSSILNGICSTWLNYVPVASHLTIKMLNIPETIMATVVCMQPLISDLVSLSFKNIPDYEVQKDRINHD